MEAEKSCINQKKSIKVAKLSFKKGVEHEFHKIHINCAWNSSAY